MAVFVNFSVTANLYRLYILKAGIYNDVYDAVICRVIMDASAVHIEIHAGHNGR